MANPFDKEKQENIKTCAKIRDNKTSKPIAVIQAVRAIQKLMPKDHPEENPEFKKNLIALKRIRKDDAIEDTIRVMAMNTINTMLDSVGDGSADDKPTEADIMKKIRSAKK